MDLLDTLFAIKQFLWKEVFCVANSISNSRLINNVYFLLYLESCCVAPVRLIKLSFSLEFIFFYTI